MQNLWIFTFHAGKQFEKQYFYVYEEFIICIILKLKGNCHISYLHICNVNQALKDQNEKQKK